VPHPHGEMGIRVVTGVPWAEIDAGSLQLATNSSVCLIGQPGEPPGCRRRGP
jgi:hypothetical protein